MGVAAYNRGSRNITRQIEADLGIREPSYVATPRPATWGEKVRARAEESARRIVDGVRRYGLELHRDRVVGAVVESVRCTEATAEAAVAAVLDTGGDHG